MGYRKVGLLNRWRPELDCFPKPSRRLVASIGGTIAASTPTDIIWAPSGGIDPYYTLDGGATWHPITLPGVSSWSSFDTAYYFDTRTVTADRVLPNTFYLYYAGQGVFETTNGGATWTKVFSGRISQQSPAYNAELISVPGQAGNLFFTAGPRRSQQKSRLLSIDQWREQRGQPSPMSLKYTVSVSARLRQGRATHQFTSLDG